MVELVDTLISKVSVFGRASSSLAEGTKFMREWRSGKRTGDTLIDRSSR